MAVFQVTFSIQSTYKTKKYNLRGERVNLIKAANSETLSEQLFCAGDAFEQYVDKSVAINHKTKQKPTNIEVSIIRITDADGQPVDIDVMRTSKVA